MRVMVDAHNLAMPTGTGIATYTRGLCSALRQMGHQVELLYGPPKLPKDRLLREIAVFEPTPDRRPSSGLPALLWQRLRQVIATRRRIWAFPVERTGTLAAGSAAAGQLADRIWAAAALFELAQLHFTITGTLLDLHIEDPPDIVHWTSPLPIRVVGARNIYTLHDLVPLKLPFAVTGRHARFAALVRAIAVAASKILTVSETSRRDIIELLGVAPDLVVNTYQAVDIVASGTRAAAAARISNGLGLPVGEYFLYFGAIEPKKNVARLIRAYLASGVQAPLVLAGKLAWKSEVEADLVSRPELQYRQQLEAAPVVRRGLRHLGHIERTQLIDLIRCAKAVTFPALYEGFGLPAIEAMALGTPVLAASTGALPEICGSSAVLVDPYDETAMSAALTRLDADAELRAECCARGLERAQRFSASAFIAALEQAGAYG